MQSELASSPPMGSVLIKYAPADFNHLSLFLPRIAGTKTKVKTSVILRYPDLNDRAGHVAGHFLHL